MGRIEDRGREETEVGSRMSEVRDQRSDVRGQKGKSKRQGSADYADLSASGGLAQIKR